MNDKKTDNLKIAHYNIFNGGVRRLAKITKVIEEINPDICGLLECVGWENKISSYKKYFKSKGYKFFYFIKANSKYNISVISKTELKINSIKKNIRHVMVSAETIDPKYPPIKIIYLHLSPISEEKRMEEISILLKHIMKLKNILIMGDFNSLSRKDNYTNKLLEKLKKNGITKYGTDYLKYDVINKIKKNKLIDVYKYLNIKRDYSAPTKFNTDISHNEKIRIDYAFVNQNIIKNIVSCKIHKSKMTEVSSDHYPLYLEIKKM